MCSDKYTRAKLSQDKVAVQGAINTSWTLHKVELLELKAEEMKHRAFEIYPNIDTAQRKMSSIDKNVTRMRASATALSALYAKAEAWPSALKYTRGTRGSYYKGVNRTSKESRGTNESIEKEGRRLTGCSS